MTKRRMMVLVMLAVLTASSPALVACQTAEWVEEASVGPETFTTLFAWGGNSSGQVGVETYVDGTYVSRRTTPVEVSNLDGAELKAIAAGSSHSLALKSDGTVWAWGSNRVNELGDGTDVNSTQPLRVMNLSEVWAIAAGSAHGLALKDDGTVWAWGFNQTGQLGNGSYTLGTPTVGTSTPVQVRELSAVKAIAGGGEHSLAGL